MRVWHTEALLTDQTVPLFGKVPVHSPNLRQANGERTNSTGSWAMHGVNYTSAFSNWKPLSPGFSHLPVQRTQVRNYCFLQKFVFQRVDSVKGLSPYADNIQNINNQVEISTETSTLLSFANQIHKLGPCRLCIKANMKYPSYWGTCQPWNWSSILRKGRCLLTS